MTWPQTVYWRLRKPASSKQMKNCELAEFGFWERAIEQVPRAWFMLENSAFRSGLSEPPMPARDGLKSLAAGLAELHVAGLRHEAVDDAVEDHAVIGALAGQLLDAGDMAGRQVGQQLDDDLALGRLHDERVLAVLDLGHLSRFPVRESTRASSCRRRCGP